ncbi:hypothetical protein BDA99DRAFT_90939 [Phascolomyces articulosus]|uniref:Uncharacterized protein n=1 Tax=Phascolomyces articulosus TaxID=60185 RepID=A0AAD5JYM3_9FUNG|nr:hypothetical protein BDA99DRAFT_90939 [Phascolomyces articulosus]
MKETRPSPVDFSALSSPNKSIKRNYGDIRQSPSHFLPNAYFLHRTMSRRVDPATTTVTTTIADPLQNNTKEGSNRYESVLSGSTYQSAITIVDGEDGDSNDNDKEQSSTTTSTPSIDDLLGELQSLTLQSTHGRDKPAVKNQTLNKEVKSIVTFFGCSAVVYFIYKNLIHFQKHSQYLAAKRAALEKIQSPLTKRWDELYAETAIIRPPAVKPLSDEEGELVNLLLFRKD